MLNVPTDFSVKLTFHIDPGHGWLEVPTALLSTLGLSAANFTKYSYRSVDSSKLYLEEDCDLTRFMVAYAARNGNVPAFTEKHCNGESFVRRLPRCI